MNPITGQGKVQSVAEAVATIPSGAVLTTSGFVGIGVPEALLAALEERFLATGGPRDVSLVFAAGQGDGGHRGLNRLGHKGLLRRVVGGHWGLIPKVAKLVLDEEIEGWNLPQGCISHLYRDAAAGKPGLLTTIGLETFVDPRLGGGRLNERSTEPQVMLHEVEGETYLFYPAPSLDVALLRGTTADTRGNVSMEREALILDNLAQAMAVKNNGGRVIVQVERIVPSGDISARDVQIPGVLVDSIVVASPEQHMQTYATLYSEAFSNQTRIPNLEPPELLMGERAIIARRAALELPLDGVVNLGIGMPEGIAAVAAQEGLLERITLTAEPGVLGGLPASGLDFGAAVNTEALLTQNAQFDFYDGGGLDVAFLGMAQVDRHGNVNVSRFAQRLAGAGGFINISQSAKTVVFVGTFTSGGLRVAIDQGSLIIEEEGRTQKFVNEVEQITFSGSRAARQGRRVLYITERCVFELTERGLVLRELASGIDLERHILALMGFRPHLEAITTMSAVAFREGPLGLDAHRLG